MADLSNEYPANTYVNLLQIDSGGVVTGSRTLDVNDVINDKETIQDGVGKKLQGFVIDHYGNANAGIFIKNSNTNVWGIQVDTLNGNPGLNFWRPSVTGVTDPGNAKLFIKNNGIVALNGYVNHLNGRISLNKSGNSASVQYGSGFSVSTFPDNATTMYIRINFTVEFDNNNVVSICSIDTNSSAHYYFNVYVIGCTSTYIDVIVINMADVLNAQLPASLSNTWSIHDYVQFSFTAYCVS